MFAKEVQDKIKALCERIYGRKEHEYAAATYKDIKDLKEIENLTEEYIDLERESLSYAYNCYLFLAREYTSLCRMSISAEFNKKALEILAELYSLYRIKDQEEAEELFSNTLRFRNFYIDDDCLDLVNLVKGSGIIDLERFEEIYQKRMKSRRTLKNDPVEMSEKYLAVIDEVEEKIEKNRTMYGMGACYQIWDLKQQYLAEYGICWTPPNILNPRVMFD